MNEATWFRLHNAMMKARAASSLCYEEVHVPSTYSRDPLMVYTVNLLERLFDDYEKAAASQEVTTVSHSPGRIIG